CYAGFSHIFEETKKTSRPVLVEVVTQRFRGHSISDPAVYRSKEELSQCMEKDPILTFYKTLSDNGMIVEAEYEKMDKEQKELVVAAMKFADESPWPDPITLGEDVFAP
ncbi:MAG TPA: thiamine pyrophosphate-dependent enzyme, partial [Rhabdochlamydiaceae bacterium]